MSIAFAEVETAALDEVFVPRTKQNPPALMHALVVSACDKRRQFLEQSARSAGWHVSIFASAEAAQAASAKFRHQLAIVDIDQLSVAEVGAFRAFTEGLNADSGPLLMVCGTEGDALEEIWARQLGTWLYLPGVDSSCDVASLCAEAKSAVQKLRMDESLDWGAQPQYAQTA